MKEDQKMITTWVIVGPGGVAYVGLHSDESDAWRVALGWPTVGEVKQKKAEGWYAAPAILTWKKPGTQKPEVLGGAQ